MKPPKISRITHLDGMRGVAIILVVLYHAFKRWPEFYPYGSRFVDSPVLAQGIVGVFLFFMISGYVIFMTLDRAPSFGVFFAHRWLRLWPAMLIASLLVFGTAVLFHRPHGMPALRDLVPGLTFVRPSWWAPVLGSSVTDLEGSFWSLYVEMKFYVIVGAVYFLAGPRAALIVLIGGFLLPIAMHAIAGATMLDRAALMLSSQFWGWFAAGALYYRANGRRGHLLLALLISMVAAWQSDLTMLQSDIGIKLASVAVALFFGLAMLSKRLQAVLSSPFLLFSGAVSYPLYLIHENAMVSMIGTVGRAAPWLPSVLVPVLPIAVLVLVAWLISDRGEPALRAFIRKQFALPKPA